MCAAPFRCLAKAKLKRFNAARNIFTLSLGWFERPEVIRLVYMVRKPLHRRKLSRREVFQRDGYSCQYCGARSSEMTLDHVIPRCKGGQHTWDNVVTACQRCNHRKAGSTPREAGMKLRVEPREPRPNPYAGFSADRVGPGVATVHAVASEATIAHGCGLMRHGLA